MYVMICLIYVINYIHVFPGFLLLLYTMFTIHSAPFYTMSHFILPWVSRKLHYKSSFIGQDTTPFMLFLLHTGSGLSPAVSSPLSQGFHPDCNAETCQIPSVNGKFAEIQFV